jgi:hypothetical protein
MSTNQLCSNASKNKQIYEEAHIGASSWNVNVAHDTVTEANATESMIPLSNVFRNRIKPEPYRTENRRQRLYLGWASNLASIITK